MIRSQRATSGVPLEHHDRNRVGSDDWDGGRYFRAHRKGRGSAADEGAGEAAAEGEGYLAGMPARARAASAVEPAPEPGPELGVGYPRAFVGGAARYDMGGRPNVVLFPPLIVSMEWLRDIGGAARVGRTLRPLTRYAAAEGRRLGFAAPAGAAIPVSTRAPILHPGKRATRLTMRLAAGRACRPHRWALPICSDA
jgi:hypothetical protein